MSPRGLEDVWGEYRYHLPHNVFLLVFAGTGIIGGILLTWALCRIVWLTWNALHTGGEKRKIGFLVIMLISWYFMLGIFELSFLGPVYPLTLLFFVTVGVGVGKL
jgi:O-antigen ligase